MSLSKKDQRNRLSPPTRLSFYIFILTIVLLIIGLLSVYNSSVVEAFRDFNDKFHFVRQQLKWTSAGLVIMLITSRLPLPLLKKYSTHIFLFSLALMVAVLIPGIGSKVQGARRWIVIFGQTLQPSEIIKLSLIIYLAHWLEAKRPLTSFLFLVALVSGLTLLQPDLGTTIVLVSISFLIFYLSGAPMLNLLLIGLSTATMGLLLIFSSPYRRARFSTFLDPTSDPLGSSYHINQVLLALGSGGFYGVGLGRSRQKYQYLPEATTDSIFAVIAEETGFIGAVLVVVLLTGLVILSLKAASQATNRYNQLLAGGIAAWIAVQAFLNLSAMVALVPLTGIPLPLISYGGSSLITILAGVGLLINVARSK